MILDNTNKNPKVHEWIEKYTKDGTLSIVTGYFTVSALAYLSRITSKAIQEYKLYALTYEEVLVIEPDFPLSAAEYAGVGASLDDERILW